MSIGGEAVCLPNSVIASLGAAPQDPANPSIPPAVIVVPPAPAAAGSPAAGAPVPVDATKAIANIKPKDPANPAGNYRVNVRNKSSVTKINNLFITDMFDPKYVPGVVVAVIPPKITFPGGPLQQTNAAFNGTSNTDLLNMSVNNMLDPFASLTIEYGVEINPTLIPGGMRHNNSLVVGSTTMALKIANLNSADPNAPISVPFYPPASIQVPMDKEVTICNGAAPVEFAKYGQCQGGAKIMNNPACGAINWSFDWVEDKSKVYCGGTSGKIVTFRGVDACQNVYEYTTKFSTTDNCPPIFDMLPMDKTVICADANALASINMWLASTGGAWFGDTGSEKTTVTRSHDYKQTTCVPGVYTVKFTITDGCSNSSTAMAILTVKATSTTTATPTVISNNNELLAKTIQCSTPMAFDQPNITTNCPAGIKSLTYTDAKTNGTCVNNYKMSRTWLATDECGTTFTIAQDISVVDNTAPAFNTKAASFTMTTAHFKLWKSVYFSKFLKATDGCSKTNMQAPTFTYSADKATVECKTIATDECGNASQYTCIVNINNSKVITKVISDDNNPEMEVSMNELEQIAAIDESGEIKDAVLYPNPTADILRIIPAVGHGTITNIKITSVDGRVMLNQKVAEQTESIITIDVKGYNAGNYIIEMEHSNKKLYKMIQKIN